MKTAQMLQLQGRERERETRAEWVQYRIEEKGNRKHNYPCSKFTSFNFLEMPSELE